MIAIWPAGLGFAREAWMVTLPEALGELTVNVAVAGLDPLIDVGLEPPSEYVTWIPLGLVVAVPTSTVTSGLAIWLWRATSSPVSTKFHTIGFWLMS